MGRIAIVTDSAACLPPELVREYGIEVVPFRLLWEGRQFRDGVDLTPTEFYRLLREARTLPTTSHPPPEDFAEAYARLSQSAEGIVSIHIPQEMSGTYGAALRAAEAANSVPVRVIDSRTAVMAQGFVVLEAARAAARGASLEEVVSRVEDMIPRVHLLAMVETLEYLRRSGRVNDVQALVGSILRIKPIFSLADGKAELFARVRTSGRAVERLLEAMVERAGPGLVHAAVFHADDLGRARRIRDQVASRLNCAELYISEFTPVMGAHTGPGVLGLAWYSEDSGG
jgi:DegV family protein with EDD domain